MADEIVYALMDTPREFARILRSAMRYAVAWIPFDLPPAPNSQFFVVLELRDTEHTVTVQGELAGSPRGDRYPLRLRPMSPTQAAQLFVLCESIDVPSDSMPPNSMRISAEPPSTRTVAYAGQLDNLGAPPVPAVELVSEPPTRIEPLGDVPPSSVPSSVKRGPPPSSHRGPSSQRSGPPSSRAGRKSIVGVSIAPPEDNGDPVLGRVIASKYRMESIVGTGSFGSVYRATHVDLQRTVAIKLLHSHTRKEKQLVERFRREAIAAGRIDHPNVTRVLDFGEEAGGITFIVMEFVAGDSLERIVGSQGRIAQHRAVEIGIQVCSALASAHEQGVVHRDIKPENVMLARNPDPEDQGMIDLVKVCDFGTAKLKDPPGSELTMGGMLCGSPAYMSPEQAIGGAIDHRTDLYGLGVTLFEAITGRLPFEAEGLAELLIAISTGAPRKPSDYVVGVFPPLEALILRMLVKEPARRPQSAKVLRAELRRVLASMPRA